VNLSNAFLVQFPNFSLSFSLLFQWLQLLLVQLYISGSTYYYYYYYYKLKLSFMARTLQVSCWKNDEKVQRKKNMSHNNKSLIGDDNNEWRSAFSNTCQQQQGQQVQWITCHKNTTPLLATQRRSSQKCRKTSIPDKKMRKTDLVSERRSNQTDNVRVR